MTTLSYDEKSVRAILNRTARTLKKGSQTNSKYSDDILFGVLFDVDEKDEVVTVTMKFNKVNNDG